MAETIIKKASEEDLAFISDLETKTFSVPWSDTALRYAINDEDTFFYIAVSDGIPVGYVSAKNIAGDLYVNNIAVSADHKRMGFGTALLRRIIDDGVSHGCNFVTLEVRASNAPAISLYTKYGFALEGIRKNYYSMPIEDALIYTKFYPETKESSL